MKGIILAGGSGTRLYPITFSTSKQLLPVYDKPMIYYPLSILMMMGIKDILIITTSKDLNKFEDLLGDGSSWGIDISYKIQKQPNGIAEAFIIGEDFIGDDNVTLILGDNLFFGHNLPLILSKSSKNLNGATVFAYPVKNPKDYGVIDFDKNFNAISVEEKPDNPKSNYAITGLYIYDSNVVDVAKNIRPSKRGELEITDINKAYLKNKKLSVEIFGRGIAWLDTGSHDSLLEASNFIQVIEKRQGLKVCCPEEISWRNGWISSDELKLLARPILNSGYGKYLLDLKEF
ncbi:glucose-1-phosphate thymidylyltransferase RfbA [Gammaproteobacteria bacterium]|nr:glucose-1-phosphate thymidylyltransferase RfbA [Gammaproteobacteria bacterium]